MKGFFWQGVSFCGHCMKANSKFSYFIYQPSQCKQSLTLLYVSESFLGNFIFLYVVVYNGYPNYQKTNVPNSCSKCGSLCLFTKKKNLSIVVLRLVVVLHIKWILNTPFKMILPEKWSCY